MTQKNRKSRVKKTSAEVFGAVKMAGLPTNDEEFTMQTREASPAHLLIKIESFSLLSEHGIDKYESREFEAGDYKWRLIIHPNGLNKSKKHKDNHISVFLTIVKTSDMPVDWEVNAIFSIFLYNQILDNYVCFQGKMQRFHAIKPQWGFSKLISKESLEAPGNGFLVDDNCVFGAQVFVMKKSQRVIERVSLLKDSNPYEGDWKISDFSKLGETWTSEEFTIEDKKWMIKIYPNGDSREKGRSVSVFLESIDSKSFAPYEKVKADCSICIKNQCGHKHHCYNLSHWFTRSSTGWGWPAFIKIADMCDPSKGFIVEDCCFIEVEVCVKAIVGDAS